MRNIKKTKQTPHQRHQREARERERRREGGKRNWQEKHLLFVGTARQAENKIKNFTPYQFC